MSQKIDSQLYFNADVYTVDAARPKAEAVAVKAGRIAAVGDEATCRAALGKGAEEFNLNGCALLPGFIDTHLHPTVMTFFETNVTLAGITSKLELLHKLSEHARRRTEAGD